MKIKKSEYRFLIAYWLGNICVIYKRRLIISRMTTLPFIMGCLWLLLSIIGFLIFLPPILFISYFSFSKSSKITEKHWILDYIRSKKELSDAILKFSDISKDSLVDIIELRGGYNNKIIRYTITTSKGTTNFIAKIYKPEGFLYGFIARYFTPMPIDSIRKSKDRLIYEANILEYLSDAGFSVPEVYAVDQENLILWMEYIPGETLYTKFQEYDTVSLVKMAFSCGNLLSGLHGKSICLIDSSLSNYLIDPYGQLSLVDFEYSSKRRLFEWDVAAFFLSFERLDICKKKEIKKAFFEGYASGIYLDLKKVEKIQNMLKPYMLVSSLDYVMRFKR